MKKGKNFANVYISSFIQQRALKQVSKNSTLPKMNLHSFQKIYLESKQHLNLLEMIPFTMTASGHGILSFWGELRNFPNADWVDSDFVPFLRAWEEVTMTYQPGNSAKKLRVMGICPASFMEVNERSLDIKS